MLKDTSIQDNIHLSPAWPHISSEVWIWLLPGTKYIVLGFCMAAARHRSSKKSNWSAFHIICVLSIPLLAGTIHTPPVSHTWFAKQKAAVPKKKLLALRCAVGTPKSSALAAELGHTDTGVTVTAHLAHPGSLYESSCHYCAGMSRSQVQGIRGVWHTRLQVFYSWLPQDLMWNRGCRNPTE